MLIAAASTLLVFGFFSCASLPDAPELHVSRALPLDINGGSGYIFSVDNESSYNIGLISINGDSSVAPLTIDTAGVYTDTLSFTPTSVTINTVQCSINDTTIVQLAVGKISVQPKGSGLIAIIDYHATN